MSFVFANPASAMSFLPRLAELNNFAVDGWVPWWIEGVQAGWVGPQTAAFLRDYGQTLLATDGTKIKSGAKSGFVLDPALHNVSLRDAALDLLADAMIAAGIMTRRHGELFGIRPFWEQAPLGRLDRRMAPLLGVRSYGIHVNGWCRRQDGLYMWIARRAMDRDVYPGMLDNMVAGGLPDGLSVTDNLLKEAHEEAGLSPAQAMTAKAVGSIQYCQQQDANRLKPDTLFMYDLEMTDGMVPVNADGEVAEFMLMPVADVAALAAQGGVFKPNCALVILDFLIRHGCITPDHPDYLRYCYYLRQPLPVLAER